MSVDSELRLLEIDLPALPDSLVRFSLLLAEDELDLQATARLIEGDMALAAAVLRAVNSSLYGLRTRVQSVQQALTYLGTREVTAIVYEIGLRAAFPPGPDIEPIWQRAGRRGLLMGRMAQQLGIDAWGSHSAGLFEECGKAVLLRHAPDHYPAMLRAATDDATLATLERTGFGVGHDALGAAMCESWGVGPAAIASVRHHLQVQAGADLPAPVPRRSICALSAIAHALMRQPERLIEVVARVAPQALLDDSLMLRVALDVHKQLDGTGALA